MAINMRKPFSILLAKVNGSAKASPTKHGGHGRKTDRLVSLTVESIKQQWQNQGGSLEEKHLWDTPAECPVCKKDIWLESMYSDNCNIYNPSPERKDPGVDYTINNFQITHLGCNLAKKDYSQEDAIDFFSHKKFKKPKIKNINKTKTKETKMVTNEMTMKTLLFGSRTGDVEGVKAFLNIVDNESAKSTTGNTNSIYDKTVERTDSYLKKILAKKTTELFEDTGLSMTDILTTEELAKGLGYKTVDYTSIIGGALGKELGNGVSVYRMTGEECTIKASWLRELVIPKSEIPSIEKTLNRSYNGKK